MSAWKECFLCVMFLLGFNVQAFAAAWELHPRASLGVGYEDNVRMSPSEPLESDTETAQMRARLVRYSDTLDLSIEPNINLVRFDADETLDRDEGTVDLGAEYDGELNDVAASIRYITDTTRTSELGLTGIVDVDRQHDALIAEANPQRQWSERWSTGGQVFWSRHDYEENAERDGLYDYDYERIAANMYFAYSERISLGVDLSVGRQSVHKLDVDSKNYAANLAVRGMWSEQWSVSASYGPARVEGSAAAQEGSVYSLGADFRGQRTTLNAKVVKEVIPTGSGALSKSERAILSAGWRASDRLSAEVATQWTRNTEVFSALNLRLEGLRYFRLFSGVNFSLSPTWSISASATWLEQKRYAVQAQTEESVAEGFSASVGVVWGGRPYVF